MKQHKYKARGGWYTRDLHGPITDRDSPYYFGNRDELIHFDSELEVKFAKQLQLRERAGDIIGWKRNYEPWDFNERSTKLFRANSRIKPDFVYWERKQLQVLPVWVEVKGMPRKESLTQIRRAIKFFPERKLLIYTKEGIFDAEHYIQIVRRK
jgi:hypothetical protein